MVERSIVSQNLSKESRFEGEKVSVLWRELLFLARLATLER